MGDIRVGRVDDVFSDRGVMNVTLEGSSHTLFGVRMQKDAHMARGDLVIVARPSGHDECWYYLNNCYGPSEGAEHLLEGDRGIVSPSGSQVMLHSNGDIVIADSSLTRIALIPAKKLLELNLLRLKTVSPFGSIIWEPEAFNVNVGNGGSDVRLTLGSAGTNFGSGDWAAGRDVGAALRVGVVYRAEIAKDGGVSLVMKDFNADIQDGALISIAGDTTVVTENLDIFGEGEYYVGVTELQVVAETLISLDADDVYITAAKRIHLDDDDGPAVDGAKLLQWLATVIIVQGKIDPASLANFPMQVLSKKVFL